MRDNAFKHRCALSWLCLPLLALLLLMPAGCGEDGYGPKRGAQAAADAASPDSEDAVQPDVPTLMVGDTAMPMPVPAGFRRVPGDHPLMRAAQSGLGSEEVVLCLFERVDEAPAGQNGEDQSRRALLRRELFLVSTLGKWLAAEISSLDFLKIKQPWQDESIEFNQATLSGFEEAAAGLLPAEREFSYHMGIIDSSPLHISFMRVEKRAAPDGGFTYACRTNSLIWRYGKILRIIYGKPIADLGQIHDVVAESVGYLRKLQSIDRNTRLSSVSGDKPNAGPNPVQSRP